MIKPNLILSVANPWFLVSNTFVAAIHSPLMQIRIMELESSYENIVTSYQL